MNKVTNKRIIKSAIFIYKCIFDCAIYKYFGDANWYRPRISNNCLITFTGSSKNDEALNPKDWRYSSASIYQDMESILDGEKITQRLITFS